MKHKEREETLVRKTLRRVMLSLAGCGVALGLSAAISLAASPGDSSPSALTSSAAAPGLLGEPFLLEQAASPSLLGQQAAGQPAGGGQMPLQYYTGIPFPDGLHISGFLQQNTGVYVNSENLQGFTNSRNSLAFARTLAQIDTNYRLDENNSFFLRTWFVYEPPYAYYTDVPPANVGNTLPGAPSSGPGSTFNGGNLSSWGNQFYNQYAVRDAWWKTQLGPLTVYTGNQIVVWGQSLAFRVGDVVNPQDFTWGFGFANLEQSRQAQWMLHPILNLPDWGPFSSNFLEAVLIPGFQPLWNNTNYADGRYDGEMTIAGRVNNGFTGGVNANGARFMVRVDQTDNSRYPGRDAVLAANGALVPPPFSREFFDCAPFQSAVSPKFLPKQHPTLPCTALLNTFLAGQSPVQVPAWHVPPVTWGNMEWGFRAHTITPDGTEVTGFFFHTNTYFPNIEWVPGTAQWDAIFHPIDYVGVTADRPVPVPASFGEYLPLVARVESVYTNHAPYGTFDPFNLRGVVFSDVLDTMVALDVDQAYAPWLTTTGNLNANLEAVDLVTLDANSSMFQTSAFGPGWGAPGAQFNENVTKHDVVMLLNIATSWWWSAIDPAWTMIYAPKGTTFVLLPSVELDPPWTKSYFFKVQDVQILGSDARSLDGGAFKGYSYISFLFQYNFNLL